MAALLTLIDRATFLIGARFFLSILLVAVQIYMARAAIRIIRSFDIDLKRERLLIFFVIAFLVVINLPLAFFVVEGLITPRDVLLYMPPSEYEPVIRPFAYAFFIWSVGSLMLVVAAPLSMIALAAFQLIRRRGAGTEAGAPALDLSRRRFVQMALMAAASMPFAVSAYGALAARFSRVIERVTVPVEGLPASLDGLTIVQMSDLHSGLFMTESRMKEYVRIANELDPDIVALTGDFVATSSSQVPAFINAISGLRARYGVFGCLGNHDMYTDSAGALAEGFRESGFHLLRNENRFVDIGEARLNVIGVDFIGTRWKPERVVGLIRKVPLDGTTLLLMHAPQYFPEAARAGIDLTLSGHTHGGQIALTIGDLILTPARMSTMFIAGLFKIGKSHLYVNRGLGTTGPPIRINAPPEITHITLRAV
jgi:predicted MPP superfamily phosphohydrolase